MSEQDIPSEVRDLLDRDQIVSLMNRYLGSLDDRVSINVEWARSLFTDDVHVVHRGFEMNGLEEIAFAHQFVSEGWARTLHVTSNHRIDLGGDSAHVEARLMAIHLHRGDNPPEAYRIANVFTADARRTSDGWRFSRLNQETVWSSGTSHLDLEKNEG